MNKYTLILYLGVLGFSSCRQSVTLKPDGLESQHRVRLTNGVISATFRDNEADGEKQWAGYNGIAGLTHVSQDSSVFHPLVSGFNLEHIFGGDSLEDVFEPRTAPMEIYRISNQEVLLYQPPTPLSGMESQTLFKMTEPHYIDITFRCIIHEKDFFKHGYVGLFWASYIDAPADRKIYFHGYEGDSGLLRWISAYSTTHGLKSTHVGKNDRDTFYYAPNLNQGMLFNDISDYRYDQPFYYGRFHNMVLAFMFHPKQGIRFSQSPSAGMEEAIYPAWDFHFVIPGFRVGREYSFRARILYKEFAGAGEVLEEYENWKSTIRSYQ